MTLDLIELSKQKVHVSQCLYSVTSVLSAALHIELYLSYCVTMLNFTMIRTELNRVNRVSHDRHYSMVFPVEHPLFKFKSRTHTGLCLRFLLIHDSLLLFSPSPCSSYWSIQALQASLQFALNPIPTDQLSWQQQQAGKLDSYSHSPQLVVGALAKKA